MTKKANLVNKQGKLHVNKKNWTPKYRKGKYKKKEKKFQNIESNIRKNLGQNPKLINKTKLHSTLIKDSMQPMIYDFFRFLYDIQTLISKFLQIE